MNNILALDSSLGALSVAVASLRQGEWLTREAFEARTQGHAERLMPMVAEVMGEAGLAFSAIDRIAVTVGPGSFTGVRVGVAAARGLALASGRPVVGATSLAVMAQEAGRLLGPAQAGRRLAVAVDARRGMVFFQLFEPGQDAASPPLLLSPDDAPGVIGKRPILLVGSGARALHAAVAAAGGDAEFALGDLQPRARSLVRLAVAGAIVPARPLYLRSHGAEPSGAAAVAP